MWDKIKKLITKPNDDMYVSSGATLLDLMGNNRDYLKSNINRIINEYDYGKIDEIELFEKIDKVKDNHSNNIRYRIKDILNAGRINTHETINKYREKLGIIKGYVYDSKLEACNLCLVKHGLKWKRWSDIPSKDKPLVHFGCRCVIIAVTDDFDHKFSAITDKEWLGLQSKKVRDFLSPRKQKTFGQVIKDKLSINYDKFIKLVSH